MVVAPVVGLVADVLVILVVVELFLEELIMSVIVAESIENVFSTSSNSIEET